jgi:hypothetical protein
MAPPLACPICGRRYAAGERFCADCGIPLVLDAEEESEPVSGARREWVRKVKPQYAEGKLVKVAGARNQAEAEFIQGLLLEEGVPSMVRRSAGFDVPDFLAAGPRDVLVPQAGAAAARDVLLEAELISSVPAEPRTAPVKLLAGMLVALMIGALIVWVLFAAHV